MKGNFFSNLAAGLQKRIKILFHNPYREVNLNWATLKYYKHLPAGKIRKHQLFGKPFYYSSPAELLHGFQEIFIDQIYKQEFTDHPYIIDCGANIGLSVIYLMQLSPEAKIVAFEPDPQNFELLAKNVESFGLKGVTLRKEAVWKENTVLQFSNRGATTSRIEHEVLVDSNPVQAIRLKDWLDKPVDFLKIDIEGAEFEVLKDIETNLKNVKNLFIEYHGSFLQNKELSEIISLIQATGFYYYIKEASPVYKTPFFRPGKVDLPYDIQLNLFCFRLARS